MLYCLTGLKFLPLPGRSFNYFCQHFHIEIFKKRTAAEWHQAITKFKLRNFRGFCTVETAAVGRWIRDQERSCFFLPISAFTKPIWKILFHKSCSPASFTYFTKKSLCPLMPFRSLSAKPYMGPFGSSLQWYIISMGDAGSIIPLAEIRGLVTTDGAVGGKGGELSAQVEVHWGLWRGNGTSWRASIWVCNFTAEFQNLRKLLSLNLVTAWCHTAGVCFLNIKALKRY
jgi:hypothetical protein